MLRPAAILPLALFTLGSGCTDAQLRHTAVRQARTLTEVQYRMVLENLAVLADNPGSMPWHASISGGAAQVADTGQGLFTAGINLFNGSGGTFSSYAPAAQFARTVVQQWTLDPITEGDTLRLLRIAYRRALGSPEMPSPELLDDLAHDLKKVIAVNEDLRTETMLFYQDKFLHDKRNFDSLDRDTESTVGDQPFYQPGAAASDLVRKTPMAREVAHEVDEIVGELAKIRAGWYGIGRKHDVPKEACYVAHHGAVYVWVCPSGIDGLTDFTLSILEMAAALQPPETRSQAAGVNYSPGFDTSF
jgi:hypothetical protein